MAISKDKIEYVAKLAQLNLSEKEKEKFSQEISQVLDFIDKLKEVKTENTELFAFREIEASQAREDKGRDKNPDKLKRNFPEEKNGLLRTKNIYN